VLASLLLSSRKPVSEERRSEVSEERRREVLVPLLLVYWYVLHCSTPPGSQVLASLLPSSKPVSEKRRSEVSEKRRREALAALLLVKCVTPPLVYWCKASTSIILEERRSKH